MIIFTLLSSALLVPTIATPATIAQNDYYTIRSAEGITYTVYRRDIEAELCKPVQRTITVQFDLPESINPTDTVLTLHAPQIIRDGSHLYLEATITQQAWERQQEWTKKDTKHV